MGFWATLRALIQAVFIIRDAVLSMQKIQASKWISNGEELAKKISGDTTDEQRKEDAKSLANHISGM